MTDPYGRWDVLMNPPAPRLIPPPELACHPVADGCPVPNAAAKFAAKAAGYGWRVFATHARGPLIHSTHGTVTRIVDSIAVRIRRGHRNAYAVWIDGKFDAPASLWLPGVSLVQLGSPELHAQLPPDQEA